MGRAHTTTHRGPGAWVPMANEAKGPARLWGWGRGKGWGGVDQKPDHSPTEHSSPGPAPTAPQGPGLNVEADSVPNLWPRCNWIMSLNQHGSAAVSAEQKDPRAAVCGQTQGLPSEVAACVAQWQPLLPQQGVGPRSKADLAQQFTV